MQMDENIDYVDDGIPNKHHADIHMEFLDDLLFDKYGIDLNIHFLLIFLNP